MEPEYINHTEMNAKTCREMMALTWSKNSGAMRIFLFAIGGFAIAYSVWLVIQQGIAVAAMVSLMVLLGLFAIFVGLWGYILRMPKSLKDQQKLWGGPTLAKTVRFLPYTFEQESPLGTLKFSYDEISKVMEGKTTVILLVKGAALQMEKAGFGDKSYADFLGFIAQKCPSLVKK